MPNELSLLYSIWVQVQLKNHPDELWEDGVRDYLAHASNIMEKFSDVVNWLKANSEKEGTTAEYLSAGKKSVPGLKNNNEVKLFQGKTGFPSPDASTSFTASWSSSVFSNNQSSGGVFSNMQSSSMFSSSQNSALFSNSQSTGPFSKSQSSGLLSNSQSSTVVSANQSSGLFSNSQSSAMSSANQGSGLFSNSQSSTLSSANQGSGLFSNSQSSAVSSANQSSGLFSNSQSSAVSSINQGSGLFSSSQNFGVAFTNQTTGLFLNSQSSSLSSASQNSGLFSNNQSTGLFSKTPTSISFGQNSAPTNNTADDVDENELEQPSSPSLKKSEEKGIVVVHEVKCKLYVKSTDVSDKDTWKDKGMGQLSIKCKEGVNKGTKESKPTIVVRNDAGRVVLNALLYPGIKTNLQKNSLVAIFHTAGDDGGDSNSVVARTFLIRTKTEEDRNKLATAIQEYAPES
ncbi:nucleoporin NUP116/NSP116 isoform X2 [Ricinus communis]|uniref:nucleoporin NUP116/NSP116 isoform X2 n=1 Tax=Ricinus communis TaxID=3988 RepID=UPI000772BCAB|nr:nucleoporin NUP116/NSP116 isoform X2 [Ricinus communis]|eukprot:XP_015571106.1 nucleoporin NUP116/NSP116 isoform X2 [Ricinus communis]